MITPEDAYQLYKEWLKAHPEVDGDFEDLILEFCAEVLNKVQTSKEWTKEKPTQEGWYFAAWEYEIVVGVVSIEDGKCKYYDHISHPHDYSDITYWLGPIDVPVPPDGGFWITGDH